MWPSPNCTKRTVSAPLRERGPSSLTATSGFADCADAVADRNEGDDDE
ncbi:hypothetical protein ACWEO2_17555 [Nocardia sp. NPDC004278]